MPSIVQKDRNGKRTARLQAVFKDSRKNKPILDLLEGVDAEGELSQKDVMYKALHLLAHRWAKKWGFDPSVPPEKYVENIISLLHQLYEGQNEMMEAILQMRSGAISADEFHSRVDGIQERQNNNPAIGMLEGASSYASGLFMLEDDDDYEDEG